MDTHLLCGGAITEWPVSRLAALLSISISLLPDCEEKERERNMNDKVVNE